MMVSRAESNVAFLQRNIEWWEGKKTGHYECGHSRLPTSSIDNQYDCEVRDEVLDYAIQYKVGIHNLDD